MSISNITCPPADGAYELTEGLLSKAHIQYDINYNNYLANHLPHGLYTLCALGASKSRIQDFHDKYVKQLEPLKKPNSIINSSNWAENIGNKNLYSDFLEYFDNEINSKGFKETFNLYYSQLMGESLGALLHPMINIGYAIEFSNPLLLSEGLAYICISPLKYTSEILQYNDLVPANPETTILDLLEDLQKIEFQIKGWNFPKKTDFLLESQGWVFKNLMAKWDLSQSEKFPDKLNELTEASILCLFATYQKQIDFYLLHGLTANHAVRIIFSNLSEKMQRNILQTNLLALLADYVVQGKPKIDINFVTSYKDNVPDETISWDNVLTKTIPIDEEHVLKIVRTLIYYMETVPMSQRSSLFTEQFIKRCAFKIADLVQKLEHYIFDVPRAIISRL